MKRIIDLEKFIKVINNKKWNNRIQLEVEGKFLKTTNHLVIKKLVVPQKLLHWLGMEKLMIDKATTKKPPKKSLRVLVENGFKNVNNRLDKVDNRLDIIENDVNTLKTDIKLIKSLPTIQKEIKELKK